MQQIRYGSIIRIVGKADNGIKGVLSSKGFIEQSVYYETYESLKELNNYRECLFQVLPRGSFEIHDEYYRNNNKSVEGRLKLEKEQYYNMIGNKMNDEVFFGSELILQHVESEQFLVCSEDCSTARSDSFKLKLQSHFSSLIIFRFEPSRNHQQAGRPIFPKEPIKIQNDVSKFFVDKHLRSPINLDKSVDDSELRPNLRGKSDNSHRYEALITHNGVNNWYLSVCCTFDQLKEKSRIVRNDLVYLQYTSNNSYLGVDLKNSQVCLKLSSNKHIPIDCIWEIILQKSKERTLSPHQTSQLQSSKALQRQTVFQHQTPKKGTYILKHFVTGKVFSVQDTIDEDDARPVIVELDPDNANLDIQLASITDSTLSDGSYINLVNQDQYLQIQHKQSPRKEANLLKKQSSRIVQPGINSFFKQINSDEIVFKVGFRDNQTSDLFIITKVQKDHIKEILHPLSAYENLVHFVDLLKKHQNNFSCVLPPERIEYILINMRKILSYLLDLTDTINVVESENIPIVKRQFILNDLYFIELMVEILYSISYKNGSKKLQFWKYQKELIKQIFQLAYYLLNKIIQANSITKLYASQWLELFLHQYIMINEPYIQQCLSEILSENEKAIKKFLHQNAIAKIIEIIGSQVPHEKYLSVLSSICVCNEIPIMENQEIVLDLFFHKIGFDFRFQFRVHKEQVQVMCPIVKQAKFRTFEEFFFESYRCDELQQWYYFLSFFHLLGDVCMKRNKAAIKFVEENYPLDILCRILHQSRSYVDFNIMQPFLKLIRFAYIDAPPYENVKFISRVICFEDLEEDEPAFVDPIPEKSKLREVRDFLFEFLLEFDTLSAKTKEYSMNLHNVLKVVKVTMQQGFWIDQQKNHQLLQQMYKICSSIKEFSNLSGSMELSGKSVDHIQKKSIAQQKNKLTKLSLINNQNTQCKQLACEIIMMLYQIENNIRVFKIAKTFKIFLSQYKILPIKTKIPQEFVVPKQKSILIEDDNEKDNLLKLKSMANIASRMKGQRQSTEEQQFYESSKWIQAFRKVLSEQNLTQFDSFELIFAELSFYQNPNVPKYSLEILKKSYGQRKELCNNIEKMIIVVKGASHDLSILSDQIYRKIERITDSNFLELYKGDFKLVRTNLIWYQSSEIAKQGIIQSLYNLGQSMKKDIDKGRSQNPLIFEDLYPDNASSVVLCEREQNFRLHQSLLFSQEIHVPIVVFMAKIQPTHHQLYYKLLHACYDFLTLLIWNHMDNKMALSKYKTLIYQQMNKNIGAIDFLKILFTNNKPLLFSEREIPIVLQAVLHNCNQLGTESYYKSKLLEFVKVLLIFNSRYINQNQTLALQKLQDSQFSQLILEFDEDEELIDQASQENHSVRSELGAAEQMVPKYQISTSWFVGLIEDYQESWDQLSASRLELVIGPELTYMYTFFAIFAQLVEEKHKINIKKCRRMHSTGVLVNLLSLSQQCWPLKRHLRAYLNRLCYAEDRYVSTYFLKKDLTTILDDLQWIIDLKMQVKYSFMNGVSLKNPVRYKYIVTYLYLYLEEILISLSLVLNNEFFLEEFEEQLILNQKCGVFVSHLQVFDLVNKLTHIERFYQKKQIGHLSKLLLNILRCIINTFDLNILLIRESLYRSYLDTQEQLEQFTVQQMIQNESPQISRLKLPTSEETSRSKKRTTNTALSKVQLIDQIFDVYFDKRELSASKLVSLMRPKAKQKDDLNETLNHKLKRIVNALHLSGAFSQFLEEEFIEVCNKMALIGQQSILAYQTTFEVTTLKDYIQNIVRMSVSNENNFTDDLRIFFLKMLSRLITEKNANNREKMVEVDLWTSDYWIENKSDIMAAQEFLVECNVADLIYQLLSESQLEVRLSLLTECLAFCIAFLIGGNEKCQSAFLLKLKQDSSNVVLQNLALIIKKLTRVIFNNFCILNNNDVDMTTAASTATPNSTQDMENHIQTVDNYDFYDQESGVMLRLNVVEPDDSKETGFKKQCLDVICRIFRVLQLLCENNNVDMKRYLRVQTDEAGTGKINSINFIEFTSVQLRIYLKILSRAIIIIPSSIMDFLIEIIQLPCKENQITLCHTTFFEDVSHMSQYFTERKNQVDRLFEKSEDLQELYEIENKILVAVLSVLEGNEEKIYKDLENKLEVSFLIEFLNQNLEQLGISSVEEMTHYLASQDKIFSPEIQRILNVCIIEKKIAAYSDCKWIKHFYEKLQLRPINYQIYLKLTPLIRNIEIIYEKQSMTVFFPYHPVFNLLSQQTKDELIFSANRNTQRDKLLGMLEYMDILFYELDHNYELNHMRLPITQQNLDLLQQLSSCFAVLINLAMILVYTVVVKDSTYWLNAHLYNHLLINILSIGQLISQITLFVMFSIQRVPIILQKHSKQSDRIHRKLLKLASEDSCLLLFILCIMSFYGAIIDSQIFVIHLVEIFSRNSLLKNVFQAISYNAKQLIVVALLGVLFVYAFSVVTFNVYFDDIYQGENQETCDSLITCMITLVTSGVIGNSMINWDPLKFFFDMLFTVFFSLLFTNIISGIMIDTFAELRDQRQKIEDDMMNQCFICAAQRTQLEKQGISFEEHIEKKHLIWNYIYYIKCLLMKDWTEFTGLEYWINDKLKRYDISWLPESIEDENDLPDKLDKIHNLLQSLIES